MMGNVAIATYPAAGTKYKTFTLNKLFDAEQIVYVEIQTTGGIANVDSLLILLP